MGHYTNRNKIGRLITQTRFHNLKYFKVRLEFRVITRLQALLILFMAKYKKVIY